MRVCKSLCSFANSSRVVSGSSHSAQYTRSLHQTSCRRAITSMEMPAMSPTMTEGGIASWKKREGEAFTAGDVLLEIETDKATIDVEAQEDGIMGKIILQDGAKNVPVGKVIALLAEEGDDISNLEVPKEEPKPEVPSAKSDSASPSPAPKSEEPSAPEPSASVSSSHAQSLPHPLFPSVHRLLLANASKIPEPNKITGTGLHGMITKGDVLAFLGVVSHPLGSAKDVLGKNEGDVEKKSTTSAKEVEKPLDGPTLRRLIVSSMLQSSLRARNTPPASSVSSALNFDSVIADYLSPAPKTVDPVLPIISPTSKPSEDYLDGLY